MSDLRFSSTDLRRLAGDTVFARGQKYHRDGAVELDTVTADRVDATVAGTDTYKVALCIGEAGAMLDTANAAGVAGEVVSYIGELRAKHRAKRNLMVLMDKLPAK